MSSRDDERWQAHVGRLWIDRDMLCNESRAYGDWRMPIADIRVIAEATDESGPLRDDWYLAFVSDSSTWREASVNATGIDEVLRKLSSRLGEIVELELARSATFASRVLFPAQFVGHTAFVFESVKPSGLLGRVWARWLTTSNRQAVHPDLQPFLSDGKQTRE